MIIGDKEITVNELKRKDIKGQLTGLEGEDIQDKMVQIATGMTPEEIDNLSIGDYMKLTLEFNNVNNLMGVEDFLKPQEK